MFTVNFVEVMIEETKKLIQFTENRVCVVLSR